MSDNEKNTIPGEPISEEQLTAVTGGNAVNVSDPIQSKECWFRAVGEPREDGRMRCRSECKGILDQDGRSYSPIEELFTEDATHIFWYICPCWGTHNCVDKWHRPCGKPPRTNW